MTPAQDKRHAAFMASIGDGYFISVASVPVGDQIEIVSETDGPRMACVVKCERLSDGTNKISFRWLP